MKVSILVLLLSTVASVFASSHGVFVADNANLATEEDRSRKDSDEDEEKSVPARDSNSHSLHDGSPLSEYPNVIPTNNGSGLRVRPRNRSQLQTALDASIDPQHQSVASTRKLEPRTTRKRLAIRKSRAVSPTRRPGNRRPRRRNPTLPLVRHVVPTRRPVAPTPRPTVPPPTAFPTDPPEIFVPGDLSRTEAGLLLSRGLRARVIAKTGEQVQYSNDAISSRVFHAYPDFGATFPDTRPNNIGGWVYVSNSEVDYIREGGVGAITFNKDGNVIDYRMILEGTTMNCGGGKTPW